VGCQIEQTEKSIEDNTEKLNRFERGIKTARESWQPALEKLVASIGEKFSAAFDRELVHIQ
jgi:structural maintenance of chromosomes protein 5